VRRNHISIYVGHNSWRLRMLYGLLASAPTFICETNPPHTAPQLLSSDSFPNCWKLGSSQWRWLGTTSSCESQIRLTTRWVLASSVVIAQVQRCSSLVGTTEFSAADSRFFLAFFVFSCSHTLNQSLDTESSLHFIHFPQTEQDSHSVV
jgi:hypothetical protein